MVKARDRREGFTVREYERELDQLIEMGPTGRSALTPERAAADVLMFAEIEEYLSVSTRLHRHPLLAQHPKVKQIFSGATLQGAENVGLARDILFELTIAGVVASAGLPADIETLTDVCTEFEERAVLIECKRPQSAEKVETNIRKAAKQLGKRLPAAGTGAVGLIAIAFSKTVTNGTNHLAALNSDSVEARMELEGQQFIEKIRRHWEKYPWVAGVLAHICVAGIDEAAQRPFSATYIFGAARPEEQPFVGRFVERLKPGFFEK